jgi:hypothetical protein
VAGNRLPRIRRKGDEALAAAATQAPPVIKACPECMKTKHSMLYMCNNRCQARHTTHSTIEKHAGAYIEQHHDEG